MLNVTDVRCVLEKAVAASLGPGSYSRIEIASAVDQDGLNAWQVLVDLKDDDRPEVTGRQALDTILNIQHALERSGYDRSALIDFANKAELMADAGSEP